MANLLDLASLDSYLYTPGTSSLQSIDDGAWAPLNNIAPNPDISGPYGFYAEAFKNSQTGEIVIAIRGTVPTMVANIAEDLELGLVSKYAPVMNAIANDAITFAKEVAQANPGATITLTGHSLGGYAAQAALVRLTQAGTANVSAVTFNAPGLPTWFLGSADPESFNSYNFNTQGDIIHTYGGTQIGESTILDVGPSPAQEMLDYSAGFLAGIGFGAKGAEATGLAYVAYKDWLTAAHTIGNFVGTNSYTGQQGIFSANATLGSETAQQFFADGQQIPPSPQLSVSPDGTISLSDTTGDTLSVQAIDGNLQGSLTPGSGLGVSNLSGLQSELQADGSGVVSQDQLNSGATSLPGGSSLFGTLTTGLGGDTSAVIGSEAPGGSAGLPGQIYAPDASSDGRYECNIPVTGTVSEVINSNGAGTVWVDSSIGYGQLTGGSPVQGTPGTWKDNNGTQYTFSGSLSSSIGTLTIIGGLLGTNPADSITIQNFNLAAAATSPGGFLGISLAYTLSLTAGTGGGSGSSATFPAGSEQSYTLSADAPSGSPETVVLTLAGANPSDFEVQIGNTIEELDPSGAFTVTLPVGATGVSFGLIDVTPDNGTSDIADGTTLTLTASVANPTNPNGSPIQSSPLSITYTPQTPDTSTVSTPGDVISGTLSGGVTTYQGDGGDDYISAGQGPNDILAQNSGSDSIIGGSGDNTVYGGSGNDVIDLNGSNDLVSLGDGYNTINGSSSGKDSIYGHGGTSIINANGGTDLIIGRNGNSQVYADTQTSVANAIADALSGSATGRQGDLLSVGDGDNTVVSGDGNDLITAGTGHDIIVMGPGDDTFEGGIDLISASANWYTTFTPPDGNGGQYVLQIYNAYYDVPSYTNPYPQPYNGTAVENEIAIPNAGVANDTIFAGDGNDLFYLGNGNNYVQTGSGDDTIFGGMGNDTVIAGSGADYIAAGGGTEYVYGGAGHDTIYGGDGNNTIIGGSGDSTITSASGPTQSYTGTTLEQNYVFGGSGNDVIYGSAGNDTLIAGSGNTTIWGQSGNEYLVGGSGKDLLSADVASNATVIAGGTGADTLYSGADTSGSYYLYGGDGTDLIVGGSGQNVIYAGDGGTANAPTSVFGSGTDSTSQTTIYGGLGVDTLTGGAGSTVIYAGDGGTGSAPDTAAAGSGDTTIYGGLGTDQIQGGSGTDVLYAGDGGDESAPTKVIASTGAATLYGGAGDDFLQDTGGGSDLIVAGTGSDTLLGTGNDTLLAGPGNDALQTYGDAVSIDINSGFGDDSVYEIGATESINFGSGVAPTDFSGGVALDSQGNNYLVLTGDSGSVAIENAFNGGLGSLDFADSGSLSTQQLMADAFGTDQVYAAIGSDVVGIASSATSGYDLFTVGVQGDDLLTTGPYDDTVSSWGDNTTITGSSESGYGDSIYSAGASASIAGGGGRDTIVGAGADDSIVATTGTMLATVSGANSIVTAGPFADTITASGSNDTLVGNADYTTFVIDDASAVVQAPAGTDTVLSSVSYTAPTNVDILTLIGSADITAAGNADSDTLKGGAGSDTLIAGTGNDLMIGGTGSTTFVVNSANDLVQDATGSVANVIQSSVSYTLPTNVNTLAFTGSAALVGTGNSGTDTLISNDAADTLIGGTGNDTFVIDNPNVVLEDSSSSANNAAESSVSYTLPTNVNTLVLTGNVDLVGTANGGNDTLVSNTGIDTLVGRTGNDLFIVNNPDDVLLNVSASDTVEMATNYSLPSNIDTLVLTGSANVEITGNSGDDRITANAGADTLIAGSGVDTFVGGSGVDTFVLNNSADVVQESSVTGSVVESTASYSLPADINVLQLTGSANIEATANTGNDSLVGAEGADTLVAGAGVDTLVAGAGLATLIGGSGNDTFVVDDPGDVIEDTASGASNTLISSVSYSMPTDVNSLDLSGDAAVSATTNGGNDLVTANAGADTLVATTGADTLVAGAATDTLIGGAGDDLFILNSSSDMVIVSAPYGVDTIESSVSLSLPSNVNILLLEGSGDLAVTANGGSDSITANAGADTLVAGAGTDTLVAGSDPDTFIGGSGSTIYVVNSVGDDIENISDTGGNRVVSSVSFTLPSRIDSLTLTGSDNLIAQGNDDAENTLIANSGDDTLVSGSAVTTFEGGDGNDTFVVNNAEDVVDATTSATNTIVSSVSYTLPDNVTALILSGTGDLMAAGNTRADSIVGNAGADTLVAGVGNDTLVAGTGPATLIGGVGNDTFMIDSSDDVIEDTVTGEQNALISSVSITLPGNFTTLELSGTAALVGTANATSDAIMGGSGADTLVAGAGTDTLIAGAAASTLIGGSGNTTFVVNSTADVIEGASAAASNSLFSSVTYTAPDNVDSLTLTGPGDIAGTGNAGDDVLTAGEGNDTLVAGSGTDTLVGGTGNTTFEVDSTSDVVTDGSATTSNMIESSVSYALPTNVATLLLTGTGDLTGTANAGSDTLIANSGVDTLVGAGSSALFVVDNSADVVQEASGSARDTVESSVDFSLPSNVDVLILTGSQYPNDPAPTGTANSANDTLVSGTGVYDMVGGSGNDLFIVNNSADSVVQNNTGSVDTIAASVSFSLPTNVDTLELTGSAAVLATGNAAADLIEGNGGNDTLVAGTGSATLMGGGGSNVFVVSSANDSVVEGNGAVADTVQSSVSYSLPTNVDTLVLEGTANLTATANGANDTLVSNSGVGTLVGGSGHDVFIVNNASDVLQNVTANDTIESSVGYTLPSGAATLVLTASATIGAAGSGADTLVAQGLNDTLVAGSAVDTLIGEGGATDFVVNNSLDNVVESSGSAQDTVSSSVNYSLPANVDTLWMSGSGYLTGTGNQDLSNTLTGGPGTDVLNGTALENTFYGGSGSDTINVGPGENWVSLGGGGTSSQPTQVLGNATGTTELTDNYIYGGSGFSELYGGPGYNYIQGGSGSGPIYVGAGANLIYGGSAGTSAIPIFIYGNTSGTDSATQSTIYGGTGYDVIAGGPGSDLIYAGTGSGSDTIVSGSGFDTIYGGPGSQITDNLSGHDVLVSGGGAETLTGMGGDTLAAVNGSDVLSLKIDSAAGGTYEFASGFGQVTIGPVPVNDSVPGSLSDTLVFGTGIDAADLTASTSILGGDFSPYNPALLLQDGSGTIEIEGGLVPGTVDSIDFSDGTSESLSQFMRADGPGIQTVTSAYLASVLSTEDDQDLTTNGRDQYYMWAFGADDVLTDLYDSSDIFAYGDNATVSGSYVWAGGSADLVNVAGSGHGTLAGANDTALSSSNNATFAVQDSSDIIQVAAGATGDSVDAWVNYTLPSNVQTLTLDSAVGGLSGASNEQGGILIANGNDDTLTGGGGSDTLSAQGNDDLLIGGAGTETYILRNGTDSIQFGTGSASLISVEAGFSYTLPTAADVLTITANDAIGVGNSDDDSLTATGGYDTLVAGGGQDTLVAASTTSPATLVGGTGVDTFVINNGSDVVQPGSSAANDTVDSSVSYSLPGNVGWLTLTGPNLKGVANSAADTLVANGGNDTLGFNTGFGQDEVLNAQSGDIIEFGSGISQSSLTFTALPGTGGAAPALEISGDGGAVTVQGGLVPGAIAGISFAGGTPVSLAQLLAPAGEATVAGTDGNLILVSADDESLTGGTGDDTIVSWGNGDTLSAGAAGALIYAGGSDDVANGSSAADSLEALGAGDTLIGGSGTESFVVNSSSSVMQEATTPNQDTLFSSASSYTLPQNVDVLVLTGSGNLQGTGNSDSDVIVANSGGDMLTAGSGVATLVGGSDGDTFVVNNSSDVVDQPNSGTLNVIETSASYTLPTDVNTLILTGTSIISGTGNSSADLLIANGNNDSLIAGSGDDTLEAGSANYITLIAGSGSDVLDASQSDGTTALVSGSGIDTLNSYYAYDSLNINNSADVIGHLGQQDHVYSSVSYTIPANLASSFNSPLYFALTGSANLVVTDQSSLSDSLIGNAGNDTLIGGPSLNVLIAGTGVDTLIGGSGTNEFSINNLLDVIVAPAGSFDSISSSVSLSLPTNIDSLYMNGNGLVGVGNSGNDTLSGQGDDELVAGSGDDSLWSPFGSTLVAGSGQDTLSPSEDSDTVVFNSGFGNDQVTRTRYVTNGAVIEFGSGITAADLTASAVLDASGEAALAIEGATGTITLDGALAGQPYRFELAEGSLVELSQFLSEISVTSSTLAGASGNLILDATPDSSIAGGTGEDTIYAVGAGDTIEGGSGNQLLYALGQSDSVEGGAGNYTVSAYGSYDTIASGANAESDTAAGDYDVVLSGDGADTAHALGQYDTIISGSTTGSALAASASGGGDVLEGGAGDDTLTATTNGNTLVAGAGPQSLISQAYDTTFVVNSGADTISEWYSGAGDTVESSVSLTLPTYVDTLILTGSGNLTGTANSDNDWLAGGAGSDTLTAGSGVDTLVAGSGLTTLVGGTKANLFIVDNLGDVVQVGSIHGADTIESSVSYSLPSNVATLALTGTAALHATGNTLSDTLVANSGNDTLVAGSGTATLVGGAGNDTFVVNKTADVVKDTSATSSNTVESSVNYTLPTDVQYLTLTGTAALSGTGNGLDDLLVGNTGKDTLTGGTGIAVIEGGTAGSDLLRASSNQTALVGGGGSSTLTGGAYRDFYGAGKVSDKITTGATANVVAINMGDGNDTLQPVSGASNVLSLGAGMDTEQLYFTKSSNNLILSDSSGDKITFASWFAGSSDQDFVTLQVVEAASASYNPDGSDALRNQALEEFNFKTLVSDFTAAGSPTNWALSNGMPSAGITGSASEAYGGDLAYYFGLNGNLSGMDLSAADSTLTNSSFTTGLQTIDSWSSISGGGGTLLQADAISGVSGGGVTSPPIAGDSGNGPPIGTSASEESSPAVTPAAPSPASTASPADTAAQKRPSSVRSLPAPHQGITFARPLPALGASAPSEPEPRRFLDPVQLGWLGTEGAWSALGESLAGSTEPGFDADSPWGQEWLSGVGPVQRYRGGTAVGMRPGARSAL